MVVNSAAFYIDHVDALSIGISAFVFISVSLALLLLVCGQRMFYLLVLYQLPIRQDSKS